MTTIKEIAKECGVSVATVSNVFTGKGRVSEERKKIILEVARKKHYVPNDLARSLKQQKTKTIGIIVEDLTVFNCPDIVDGIHEYLESVNYTYILGNLRLFKRYQNNFYHHEEYAIAVKEEFQIMKSKRVRGIIYVGAHNRTIQSIPLDTRLPIVMTYGQAPPNQITCVNYDDEKGAFDAVEKLISSGHRRIGLITGDTSSRHTTERTKGYCAALAAHQLTLDESLIYQGSWDRDAGYSAASVLLAQNVTAIFCMNDLIAAGVYDFANRCGLKIGEDLSVIGFDNRDICTVLRPTLTTIALPLNQMGRTSAKLLIHAIEHGEENLPPSNTIIPCDLINRSSVSMI